MKKGVKIALVLVVFSLLTGVIFAFVFDHLQARRQLVENRKSEITHKEETKDDKVPKENNKEEIAEGLRNAMKAVFSINVSKNFEGYGVQPVSTGSSVLYKEDEGFYYFITNHHVISKGNLVEIHIGNNKIPVTVVGSDEDTDLAVFKVAKPSVSEKLIPAKLADMKSLQPVDTVYAVGNALGYGQSITKGIVSAVERSVSGKSDFAYKLIQTDAAINPGNSGGALVNTKGEVVGINSLKITDSNFIKVEGMGFAIPIDAATGISDTILANGYLPKTFLGVMTQPYNDPYGQAGFQIRGIVVVNVVPGSAAEAAGIQPNDIIIGLDEISIEKQLDLSNYIKSKKPSDVVKVKVLRDQTVLELEATLGETKQ